MLEVGDVVTLKSGGAVMTVDMILDGSADCVWHTQKAREWVPTHESYSVECLKAYVAPPVLDAAEVGASFR